MHQSFHPPIGLHVHVPFCVSKGAYCDFASYPGRQSDIPRYVETVVREITRRGAVTGHPKANTIFLGGGAPSLLDELQVTRILDALREALQVGPFRAAAACPRWQQLSPGSNRNGNTGGSSSHSQERLRQQFLNFLPLPQGHGSFRPTERMPSDARCCATNRPDGSWYRMCDEEPRLRQARIRGAGSK